MIIEWPLNGLFHVRRDVIIMSRMVVIRFPSNDGRYLKCQNFVILIKEIPAILLDLKSSIIFQEIFCFIVKSRYYDDQKKNEGVGKSRSQVVFYGRSLFCF